MVLEIKELPDRGSFRSSLAGCFRQDRDRCPALPRKRAGQSAAVFVNAGKVELKRLGLTGRERSVEEVVHGHVIVSNDEQLSYPNGDDPGQADIGLSGQLREVRS